MPAISPRKLVEAVLSAIEESGFSAILLSPIGEHPRKVSLSFPSGEAVDMWVYVWTLTHGGRPTLPDEYRIQMTTVDSPLPLNPRGPTILIGYEPNLHLFAGFDVDRHHTFAAGSPSVQIDIRVVREALQRGLVFDRKSNKEIAVGIRPDQLVSYALNARVFHRLGRDAPTFDLMCRASGLQSIPDAELSELSEPRMRIVKQVSRLSRDANFRQQVLVAYDHRCAVTRAQLRLVEAAHILPVGAPNSNDLITNGLALSPTYHRAFDNGLIYLTESYEMVVNPAKEAELRALSRAAGIDGFKATLGRIFLPPDPQQRPRVDLIRKANQFRLIPPVKPGGLR
ncbi:MAG: HNH endonuclease [Planctomycetia bacterium]|nr:HNH endonuclease [Planctomycetia bacterium]